MTDRPVRVRVIRFAIGRALIHFGLRIMPQGRVRSELYAAFDQWATRVRDVLANAPHGCADMGRGE